MDETSSNLVDFLIEEMKAKSLSPADMTKRGGLSPSQVSKILNRESPAGKKALLSFAKALGLPSEVLFEKAGIIKASSLDEKSQEILHIFKSLKANRQSELVEYARLQLKLQEGNDVDKRSPTRPRT